MGENDSRDGPGRRAFLLASARALGAVAALPPLVSLAACGPGSDEGGGDGDGDGGPTCGDGGAAPQCTVDANTLVLPLASNAALQSVGGSLFLSDSRYRDPVCGESELVVVQLSQGRFAAFSASCTHACCTVQAVSGGFTCPCHGSDFNLSGQVTRGPASSALPPLAVCFDGCSVYVQLA